MVGPTGCSRYTNAVTTPKFAPAPRSAQKRSGCSAALAVTRLPSARTTSAARRFSAVSTPAAAFNCYAIVDRNNEVVYQGALSPIDLSDEGAPARGALRARGQQLIAMDTENCPAIDRINLATRGGPATVEEIVGGMRSATP